jgi:F0F1-type ATP synthase assembly protein I
MKMHYFTRKKDMQKITWWWAWFIFEIILTMASGLLIGVLIGTLIGRVAGTAGCAMLRAI